MFSSIRNFFPTLFFSSFINDTKNDTMNTDNHINQKEEIESPLQIINDISLFRDLLTTYYNDNEDIDDIKFDYSEYHFNKNIIPCLVVFGKSGQLKFNLKTLRPCRNSSIQGEIPIDLMRKILSNTSYQYFAHTRNFSFLETSYFVAGPFSLNIMEHYVNYYFNLDYDSLMETNNDFLKLSEDDKVSYIQEKHLRILSECKGLRFNI